MEIKQLIIGLIQYDQSDINIDGNKYFSQSDVVISFESVEDVIQKCKEKLNNEYDEYKIKITHEIFDHTIDSDNLSYEDFVYKYGPSTHYFSSKSDSYCDALNNKNSDLSYLDKLEGELVYPEDFRKTKNKFDCGDICILNHFGQKWYVVIYKTPSSLYDLFGKDKPHFERGYFIEALCHDCILDFDHVSESDIEFTNCIPESYKEFLEILSKLIKLDIKEEYSDLNMVEDMAQEYFYNTVKWNQFKERCLEKIREKEEMIFYGYKKDNQKI